MLGTGRVLEPSFEEILLLDGKVRVKQVDGTKCTKPWNRARQGILGKDEVYGKWDFKNRLDCETV